MFSAVAQRRVKHDFSERAGDLSDGSLLERYLTGDEALAQAAFEALVVRHGPMVLGICRHVLAEEHDAEDAFQATFLVLAQKGGSIRNRTVLAGWLHEVAHRIAIKAHWGLFAGAHSKGRPWRCRPQQLSRTTRMTRRME